MRLGRTSAQTTQGLVTGFGGHSSKGLPFSNMLQDRKHGPVCKVVLFQSDISDGFYFRATFQHSQLRDGDFSYQNLNT